MKLYRSIVHSMLYVTALGLQAQNPISPSIHGQNAWYTVYTAYSATASPDINDHFLKYIAECKASGAKFCRIGGANANILGNSPPSPAPITWQQIQFLVKKIRDAGMEPIIQVPYPNDFNDNSTLDPASDNAADIVDHINNDATVLAVTGGPVTNWIIANEPDKDTYSDGSGTHKIGYNYNMNLTTSPANIAKYIRQFAIEMRKKDPGIKIFGPEMAEYSHHMFFGGSFTPSGGSPLNFTGLGLIEDGSSNDISGLIGTTDPLGFPVPASIQGLPYIDYVSFHYYNPSGTRTNVINEINIAGDNWKLHDGLANVAAACTSPAMVSKRTSTHPLKIALTEVNVDNSSFPSLNPTSFLAGQFWTDFLGLCMKNKVEFINYWSSSETAYGYMETNSSRRSSYWHFTLAADYFKSGSGYTSTYYPATINDLSSPPFPDVKSFAAKVNNQVVVVLMNQKVSGGTQNYVLNTNGTASGGSPNISFSTGAAHTHPGTIGPE